MGARVFFLTGAAPGSDQLEQSLHETVSREFLAAYFVSKGSPLVGKTVKDAGIATIPSVFLVSIERPASVSNNNNSAVLEHAAPAMVRRNWNI